MNERRNEADYQRIAQLGAKQALIDLGLDDEEFRKSLKDMVAVSETLKDVATAWQSLGWVRKALIWFGTLAAGGAALFHFVTTWFHRG